MNKKIVFGIVAGIAVIGGGLIRAICKIGKNIKEAEEYKAEALMELDEAHEICEEASEYLEASADLLDASRDLLDAIQAQYGIDDDDEEDFDDESGDC